MGTMDRARGRKKTKKVVELTAEEQRALDLRVAGHTFREIGELMGCGKSKADELVSRALKHSNEAMARKGTLFRELEAQRLDKLMATLWQSASSMATDSEERNRTIDRVLKIMERRAKMLGIDAPTRSELTGKDGKPIETVTVAKVVNLPPIDEIQGPEGPVLVESKFRPTD